MGRDEDAWQGMGQRFKSADNGVGSAAASTEDVQVMSLYQRPYKVLHLLWCYVIMALVVGHPGIGIERDELGEPLA